MNVILKFNRAKSNQVSTVRFISIGNKKSRSALNKLVLFRAENNSDKYNLLLSKNL